ncbi:MAG: N-acetyltransferase [Bacteroidetes bacterium]|nr:MAG: N-acetyltransferase [Bacteroidota bacterium]
METNRLTLEIFAKEEFELFHAINTNEFVRIYLWDNEVVQLSLSKEIVEESNKRYQTEKWGLWKIILTKNKECVGYVGLWYFFDENQPQLLYALLPEYTGKGYATEASMKIIEYVFEKLNFDYISASLDKPNSKSINVCEKLGMERVNEQIIEGKPILFYKRFREKKCTQQRLKCS